MTVPTCESCSLPLTDPAEWAPGSRTPPRYCRYCTDASGALRPHEDVLHDFAALLTRTMGLHAEAAQAAALDLMSRQPAWQSHPRSTP